MEDVEKFLAGLNLQPNPFETTESRTSSANSHASIEEVLAKHGVHPVNFFKRYLLTLTYKYGRSLANTEPYYQDILINGVLRRIPGLAERFEPDKSPHNYYWKRWLTFSVRNELKALRCELGLTQANSPPSLMGDKDLTFAQKDSFNELQHADTLKRIHNLCEKAGLTPAETKVLIWLKIDGFTQAEIQAIMEKKYRSSVTHILDQATTKMREFYGDALRDII